MTEACEPHVKNLTLSHCWKFIKEAVFEMQRARKERTGKVGKADSRN